jgi:hypothetical protein
VEIGYSNDEGKSIPRAKLLLQDLIENSENAFKITGVPLLVLINPQNGRIIFQSTERMEKNIGDVAGHDPTLVTQILQLDLIKLGQ